MVAALPQLQLCSFNGASLVSLLPLQRLSHLRRFNVWFCSTLRLADLLPIACLPSMRVLEVELPAEELEAARAFFSGPECQHLERFRVGELDQDE